MRTTTSAVLFAASVLAALGSIAAPDAGVAGLEKAATASAEAWLKSNDAGKFSQSWTASSEIFRNATGKEQWNTLMKTYRAPLGKVLSRKLKSATFATTLPGAPDGKYVVIQYDTSFENKQSAVETITPMIDKDNQWRVSGYFIK